MNFFSLTTLINIKLERRFIIDSLKLVIINLGMIIIIIIIIVSVF